MYLNQFDEIVFVGESVRDLTCVAWIITESTQEARMQLLIVFGTPFVKEKKTMLFRSVEQSSLNTIHSFSFQGAILHLHTFEIDHLRPSIFEVLYNH